MIKTMDAKEKALDLCQKMGRTTMFTDFNEGYTLSLGVAKLVAEVAVDEILKLQKDVEYWEQVKCEINNLNNNTL